MDYPDAKKHLIVSLVKSSLRIIGSLIALLNYSTLQNAMIILAATYGLAEAVGIYEELV